MGQSFKDLVVWQRAVALTTCVYQMTAKFPDTEPFGLTNRCGELPYQLQATLRKDMAALPKGNMSYFLAMRGALHRSSKHRLSLPGISGSV